MPFISSFGWDSTVLTVASTASAAAVCNWLYKAMQTANFKKQMHSFIVVKYLDYEMSGSLAVKVHVRTPDGTTGKGGNLESTMTQLQC